MPKLFPNLLQDTEIDETPEHEIIPPITEHSSQEKQIPQIIEGINCAYKYDEANKVAFIWIIGNIGPVDNYSKIIALLLHVAEDITVHMYINSRGGSISTGCNILAAMERCKAQIITYNLGIAASCGSLILAFGDKISICRNATTMFHNAGMGSFDSVHRLLSQTSHMITMVSNLFSMMQEKGIITEDEVQGIVKQGQEYYIPEKEMKARLQQNNLWYQEA